MHERWTEQLSEYLDDTLSADDRRAVEAHLADCAACRGALDDLRAVVAAVRALGPIEPPVDLWPGIESSLEPRLEPAAGQQRRVPGVRRVSLSVPQLAAAACLLVAISATATWWAGSSASETANPSSMVEGGALPAGPASMAGQVRPPREDLAVELARLQSVLAGARDRLDPNTARILDKNLLVVERAIEESYQALAQDPGNEFLAAHLERVFERKVQYLREAAQIIGWAAE
jgi:anti-sigma factor RsiW